MRYKNDKGYVAKHKDKWSTLYQFKNRPKKLKQIGEISLYESPFGEMILSVEQPKDGFWTFRQTFKTYQNI